MGDEGQESVRGMKYTEALRQAERERGPQDADDWMLVSVYEVNEPGQVWMSFGPLWHSTTAFTRRDLAEVFPELAEGNRSAIQTYAYAERAMEVLANVSLMNSLENRRRFGDPPPRVEAIQANHLRRPRPGLFVFSLGDNRRDLGDMLDALTPVGSADEARAVLHRAIGHEAARPTENDEDAISRAIHEGGRQATAEGVVLSASEPRHDQVKARQIAKTLDALEDRWQGFWDEWLGGLHLGVMGQPPWSKTARGRN